MDSYEHKYLLTWLLMHGTAQYNITTGAIKELKRAAFGDDKPSWSVSSLHYMRGQGYIKDTPDGEGVVLAQKALDELVSDSGTNYPEVDCG